MNVKPLKCKEEQEYNERDSHSESRYINILHAQNTGTLLLLVIHHTSSSDLLLVRVLVQDPGEALPPPPVLRLPGVEEDAEQPTHGQQAHEDGEDGRGE